MAAKVKNQQTRKLRRAYIYSLVFLSFLTFFAVYVVTDAIFQHRLDSSIINYAGRQRLLSQVITKNIIFIHQRDLFFSLQDSLQMIDELQKATSQFIDTHQRLQERKVDSLRGQNSEKVKMLFKQAQPHFDMLVTAAQQFLLYHKQEISEKNLAQVQSESTIFLGMMDKIVVQYVADADQMQLIAIYKTIGLGILFLGSFLLMSFFVFEPAVAQINKSIKVIQESTEEIATSEEELRQQNDTLLDTQKELESRRDALRASLAFQKGIFDNAGMVIISSNEEGVISAFNAAAETLLGYRATDLIGKEKMEIFFSPEEIKKQTKLIGVSRNRIVKSSFGLFAADVNEGNRVEREWIFTTQAGELIPILMSITTIRDAEQQLIGYLGIGSDISKRKVMEKQLQTAMNDLQDLYDYAPCGYHSIDKNGYFVHINQTELQWLGYTREEVVGKMKFTDIINQNDHTFKDKFETFKNQGKIENVQFDIIGKGGQIVPVVLNATAVYDEKGDFLMTRSVMLDNADRKRQEAIIIKQTEKLQRYVDSLNALNTQFSEEKEKYNHLYSELRASINYAKRIQSATLPETNMLSWFFKDHFVLLKPRDVVSGDFYWFSQKREKIIIIAADCTGHGVPGAFMSLIGNNLLNRIVNTFGVTSPELILYELHKEIRSTLRQQHTDNRDGMDIAVCVIDKDARMMEFAGANNPLYYVQKGELQVIKGDKKSIGGLQLEEERLFTKHTIHLGIQNEDKETENIEPPAANTQETVFYLFSDGYKDQFGGEDNRKFMSNQFKEMLLQAHQLPMSQQKQILEEVFEEWRGENNQIDDVLVLGIKI